MYSLDKSVYYTHSIQTNKKLYEEIKKKFDNSPVLLEVDLIGLLVTDATTFAFGDLSQLIDILESELPKISTYINTIDEANLSDQIVLEIRNLLLPIISNRQNVNQEEVYESYIEFFISKGFKNGITNLIEALNLVKQVQTNSEFRLLYADIWQYSKSCIIYKNTEYEYTDELTYCNLDTLPINTEVETQLQYSQYLTSSPELVSEFVSKLKKYDSSKLEKSMIALNRLSPKQISTLYDLYFITFYTQLDEQQKQLLGQQKIFAENIQVYNQLITNQLYIDFNSTFYLFESVEDNFETTAVLLDRLNRVIATLVGKDEYTQAYKFIISLKNLIKKCFAEEGIVINESYSAEEITAYSFFEDNMLILPYIFPVINYDLLNILELAESNSASDMLANRVKTKVKVLQKLNDINYLANLFKKRNEYFSKVLNYKIITSQKFSDHENIILTIINLSITLNLINKGDVNFDLNNIPNGAQNVNPLLYRIFESLLTNSAENESPEATEVKLMIIHLLSLLGLEVKNNVIRSSEVTLSRYLSGYYNFTL